MPKSAAQRSAEYRAKDVDAYRKRKAEYARSDEQRKKRTEYMRKYRSENRARMNEQANKSHKKHRQKNKPKVRDLHYRSKYGITLADFDRMRALQCDKCKICESPEPKGQGTWHVDHCHITGVVRGLLCSNCNTKLGWYERLRGRIENYVETAGAANEAAA